MGVIEFGSTARHDTDQYSDIDICAIVDDSELDVVEGIRQAVASRYGTDESSLVCYSLSSLDHMVRSGSLFTWHLRLEGRILSDPDGIIDEALASLVPYRNYGLDVAQFKDVFADVVCEYLEAKSLNTFELHVLFVVARNICMLLTVREGHPEFGRRTVVPAARALFPSLPVSPSTVDALMAGHLAFMRNFRVSAPFVVGSAADRILKEVRALLSFAEVTLK